MIKPLLIAAAVMLAAPALAHVPAATTTDRPFCSPAVTDGCQQSKAQQARAMTGAQVDARDARNGGKWAPDNTAKVAGGPYKQHIARARKAQPAPAAAAK